MKSRQIVEKFYRLLAKRPRFFNELAKAFAERYDYSERWAKKLLIDLADVIEKGEVTRIRRQGFDSGRVLFGTSDDTRFDEMVLSGLAREKASGFLRREGKVSDVEEPCRWCEAQRHIQLTADGWDFGICHSCRDVWLKVPQGMNLSRAARFWDILVLSRAELVETAWRDLIFPEDKGKELPHLHRPGFWETLLR